MSILLLERKNRDEAVCLSAVGLTRSRGVNRVMPVNSNPAHSKGLAVYRKEDVAIYAILGTQENKLLTRESQ